MISRKKRRREREQHVRKEVDEKASTDAYTAVGRIVVGRGEEWPAMNCKLEATTA